MKKIILIALAMVLGLLVSGCAINQTLPTQSGRPEVTIIGIDKKQIKDAIVNVCLSGGCTIKRVDDYTVVCAKRNESFGAVLMYGTRAGGAPEGRVTFTLVDVPNGVRVFGWETLVSNPNTAFENVNDATNLNQAQEALENLKSQFNPTQPNIYKKTGKRYVGLVSDCCLSSPPNCYWELDKTNWVDGKRPPEHLLEWYQLCR